MEGSNGAAAAPGASHEATGGLPGGSRLPTTPESGAAAYHEVEAAFHAAGAAMACARAKLSALGTSWNLIAAEKGECQVALLCLKSNILAFSCAIRSIAPGELDLVAEML